MTSNNAGILTFRAFAIYAVIYGLIWASKSIHFLSGNFPGQEQLVNRIMLFLQIFGPLLLLVIFSVILWKLAPRLTNKIFANDNQFAESTAMAIAIISLVLSCIGLYLLVGATARAIKTGLSTCEFLNRTPVSRGTKIYMLTTILKFAVGFGLLLRGKELVVVLHKQRNE